METPASGFAAEMAAFTISAKRSGYLYAGAGFAPEQSWVAAELYDATRNYTFGH
jgi:hypothetical protein